MCKMYIFVLILILCIGNWTSFAVAQDTSGSDADAARAARLAEHEKQVAEEKEQAQAAYQQLADAYLNNQWDELDELLRTTRRYQRYFDRDQRMDLAYITKNRNDFHPKWWEKCSSPSNISFSAEIWNRPVMANYMPTRHLGFQAVQAQVKRGFDRRGQYQEEVVGLTVICSWQPGMVNSDVPGTGKLAEIHSLTEGDLGEVIVWHELGHCYITNNLPMDHVLILYRDHQLLFEHLQEFYADLTALYHASPRSRRVALMLRLEGLDHYDDSEAHSRASHAIGSLLLHEVLANPDDWPSMHFPPAVPKQQVELNTIIYLYEHMDPKWSVKEARALREMAGDFINKSGEKTLRARGVLPLPGRLEFSLMLGQDHELQDKRDAYVSKRLEELIASGRADKLEEGETYEPRLRIPLRDGEVYKRDPDSLRMDIPN